MTDNHSEDKRFGVPDLDDEFDDEVIPDVKSVNSTLANKTSTTKKDGYKTFPKESLSHLPQKQGNQINKTPPSKSTTPSPGRQVKPLNNQNVTPSNPTVSKERDKNTTSESRHKIENESGTLFQTVKGLKIQSTERELGTGYGIPHEDESGSSSSKEDTALPVMSTPVSEIREGNDGFGSPQIEPTSEFEDEIIPKGEDNKFPRQNEFEKKKAETVEKEFEGITLQKSFVTSFQKIYLSFLAFLAAILGFYTITQTINFIIQLKDWPALAKYPLYTAIGILAFIIIFFIYKLVRSWFALKQSPQISLEMLSTISKRRDLQNKCYVKIDEACDDLYAILNSINEDEYHNTLQSMHISDEEISDLFASKNELRNRYAAYLSGRGRESSREWLDSFADRYQTKLDNIAEKRIKYFSYRGGITATISHIPSMDRFIVLSAMFGLVKDLLGIYNIRPSRINTMILLSKVIINTFCAGYVQEGAESFSEGVNKALEAFKITFTSIPYIKDIIGTSVALGTEAMAHAFLINRVGVAAQQILLLVKK